MNKSDEKKIEALIHSLGLKYNLQDDIIKKIVNSPYKFTKEIITNLNFEDINTEEEFDNLKVNFIYKYIGKFYTTYDRLVRRDKQSESLKIFNKNRWKKE